ncbi:MAG: nitronate monooxygenase [Actinomycetota bacterium]
MLQTELTTRFGLDVPIAQAGMAFAGMTPALAAAVAEAGGLGSIAVGAAPPPAVEAFAGGFAQAAPGKPLNLNFITVFTTDEHIDAVCAAAPSVASFHWGHPKPEWIARLSEAGVSVWEQVGTVERAVEAVDAGVEVVVAQGLEAGGHNFATLPTFAVVPAVADAVGDRALVLAAGGIVDGRTLAAALALGADGAWVGTRLVATPQSSAAAEYKARLVGASGVDTVRTSMFGPDMPDFNPMRVLRNGIVAEFEANPGAVPDSLEGQPIVGRMDLLGQPMDLPRFTNFVPMAGAEGDFDQLPLLAGQGVGGIDAIDDATGIVRTMAADAARLLGRA